MIFRKISDVALNVLLPLVIGYVIYNVSTGQYVINYLPDGLWAYAFVSALSIIWNRQLPFFWIVAVFVLATLVEFLQWLKLIPGTPDLLDIVVYFLFITVGLLINYYSNTVKLHPKNN
ncbi:MAG TPA: hypothetical protein PKC39_12545 [Ferruginibacter sp.]|nr:hypothetical protein [Ferruginibacter sp.]HMP21780.1 hypothetical protein [Ferruginibacter sp.]